MQHTTNYSLPQWEASDTVKREDVNGAMSAVDTALTGLDAAVAGIEPSALVKVYDHTLAADTVQHDINAAQLGLADYAMVFLLIELNAGTTQQMIDVRIDNIISGYLWESGGLQNNGSRLAEFYNSALLVLRTVKVTGYTHCLCHTLQNGLYKVENLGYAHPLSEVGTINLQGSTAKPLPAGSRFVIWALRY